MKIFIKKKYFLFSILLFTTIIIGLINANIRQVILFIQESTSIGNVTINGIKIIKPDDYILEYAYEKESGNKLYGFIPVKNNDFRNDIVARYFYTSVNLNNNEFDIFLLDKEGADSHGIANNNRNNKDKIILWKCKGDAISGKVLDKSYSDKHITLYIESKSIVIFFKGDYSEIRKFNTCS